MVYTCYEMVRDCRADKADGWRYFTNQYVPVIRRILEHYSQVPVDLEPVLRSLRKPDSTLFQSMDPSPERWFLAQLRQVVLEGVKAPVPEITLDLSTVADALSPLTMIEKQAAWLETMGYDAQSTGAMMRISPQTVEKVRTRAAELIRGKVDAWRRTLLADNGISLGREAALLGGKDCLEARAFLDVLDGRTTWRNKELMADQINACWHCVDHYSRLVEVLALVRACHPLSDAEAAPYHKLLGVEAAKKSGWKRLLGA
jgi:hypothetical protein